MDGLKDKGLEYKLNNEFEAEGKQMYNEYLSEIKDLEELGEEGRKYGKTWYEIINENDDILSIVIYNHCAQGSSNTTRKFYNIDKKNETVLTLEGMFEGSDYVNIISKNIISQMRERTKQNPEDVYWIDDDIYNQIYAGGSQNSAFEQARQLICQNTSYANTISISCIPIYYLEPNTTIYVEDKESSIEGYYVINTISLPLTYNGNMTISASKAITIQ